MPPDAEGPQPGKSAAQDDENLPKVKKQKHKRAAPSCFKRFDALLDFLRNKKRFKPLVRLIFMFFFSDRQISQEDKNWEQNIQELQKKVSFNSPSQATLSGTTSPLTFCFPLDSTE